MNDHKRKSNYIVPIYLQYAASQIASDFKLNIPFPVKSIRYINSSWATDQIGGGVPGVINDTNIAYVSSSNLPNANFLCLLDSSTSNKSFEIIYENPQTLQGTYTFHIKNMDGSLWTPTDNIWVILTLEFNRE